MGNNIDQPNIESEPRPLYLCVFLMKSCYDSHWLNKILHATNHIFDLDDQFFNDRLRVLKTEKEMLLQKYLLLL